MFRNAQHMLLTKREKRKIKKVEVLLEKATALMLDLNEKRLIALDTNQDDIDKYKRSNHFQHMQNRSDDFIAAKAVFKDCVDYHAKLGQAMAAIETDVPNLSDDGYIPIKEKPCELKQT